MNTKEELHNIIESINNQKILENLSFIIKEYSDFYSNHSQKNEED